MARTDKLACITEVSSLTDTHVLVRAALNVPVQNGVVTNQFRIARALPTLRYLIDAGARIVLIAHLGRDPRETLRPVYSVLKNYLPLSFMPELTSAEVTAAVRTIKSGEILMLENLRGDSGEVANNRKFAQKLASYADIYVNDAFPDAHRDHASMVGIPKYLPSYMGIAFRDEYTELGLMTKPESPSLFILGGAKLETKIPLVKKFLKTYDRTFIGGALANDFFAAKGYEVGHSLVSPQMPKDVLKLHDHKKLLLPLDVVVQNQLTKMKRVVDATGVFHDEIILDVGPKTIALLQEHAFTAKTILWNGPLGNYEGGYADQTLACARMIARSSARTIVGGGDTVAAIESLGINEKFDFLSSAGGAMLTFLEAETLPAIEALKKSNVKKKVSKQKTISSKKEKAPKKSAKKAKATKKKVTRAKKND